MPDVKEILLDNEYLTNQNANYRSYCQDISDFCLPRKGWINTMKFQGDRIKFNFLYDSTAISSVRDSAAGMQTYHTNPTSRWFGIRYRDPKVRDKKEVQTFCHDAEDWAFAKLDDAAFYNTDLEWKTDLLAFGTGTFGMFEDPKYFCRFKEIPVANVNRVLDAAGRLAEIYINFKLTARQAYKLFGNTVGESVLKSLEKKPFELFEFVHFVGERYERESGKEDSKNMPYSSCWIGKKDKNLILESGYMEMPYISEVFYSDSVDPNGFSPCMDCFAEIKLVNAMQRTFIRADMKAADPGYILPSKGFVLPLNLNPGATNYRDSKTKSDDIQVLPMGNGKLNVTMQHIQMVQATIRQRLFVDLFRSLNEITKQMTVLETQQRISQAMSILGPVVNRQNGGIGLMVQRLINMGARNPMSGFPELPDGLENETYDLLYLSPLAKAQRQSEVVEIQSFLNDVAGIGAVMPNAYDNIDEDKTIGVLHRIRGITPEILRDDDAIEQMRKQRQEQNQLMQSLQMGGSAAEIAKTGAEAHKAGQEAEAVGAK